MYLDDNHEEYDDDDSDDGEDFKKFYQKRKTKLEQINASYDPKTIEDLKNKLINQAHSTSFFFKPINSIEQSTDIGIIMDNNYSINNFDLFIKSSLSNFILFQWKDLSINKNMLFEPIYHGLPSPIYNLSKWNYYITLENYFSPIKFEIENTLQDINNSVNKKPLNCLIKFLNELKLDSSNQYFYIQSLLKYSFFYPLIKLKIDNFDRGNNLKDFTIHSIIKTIEQELNALLGNLIIYLYESKEYEISLPLVILLFSFEPFDSILFFLVFKIDENDYIQIFNDEKKSMVQLSRIELTHIDELNPKNDVPLWKINLTNSKIHFISYGYMSSEYK